MATSNHKTGTKNSQNMSSKEVELEDEEEDPYDKRIKKSGCAKYHYALQVRVVHDMILEHGTGWLECQLPFTPSQPAQESRECVPWARK